MTLFLHVGFPKTGTSSIQATLHAAGDYLRNTYSINYPEFASNHWQIALPFLENQKWHRLERQIKRTGRNRQDFIRDGEALLKKFERAQSKFRHNILSSEHFISLEEKPARNLLSRLESMGTEVKVIVYVRHPAEDVSSRIQQNIKSGARRFSEIYDIHNRQESEIKRLVNVYGKSRIIPRKFGHEYFINGDLFDDFFHVVDPLNKFVGLKKIRKNDSLSTPALLVIDKLYSIANEDRHSIKNRRLFEKLVRNIKGPKFLLPRTLVERYVADHQEFLSYLQSEFGLIFNEVDMNKFPEELSYEFSDETLLSIAEILHRERPPAKKQNPIMQLKRTFRRLIRAQPKGD